MKKHHNYILIRLILLISLPVIIWGFLFSSREYAKESKVPLNQTECEIAVYGKVLSKENWDIFDVISFEQNLFGAPSPRGIIASGQTELHQLVEKHPLLKPIISKAIAQLGDPNATLVYSSSFFGEYDNSFGNNINLIPGKLKRYTAGLFGAIGFWLISALLTYKLFHVFQYILKRHKKRKFRPSSYIKNMVNNPNPLKRGLYRSCMFLSIIFSVLFPAITYGSFAMGLVTAPFLLPIMFITMVLLAKGTCWIIDGFRKPEELKDKQ